MSRRHIESLSGSRNNGKELKFLKVLLKSGCEQISMMVEAAIELRVGFRGRAGPKNISNQAITLGTIRVDTLARRFEADGMIKRDSSASCQEEVRRLSSLPSPPSIRSKHDRTN